MIHRWNTDESSMKQWWITDEEIAYFTCSTAEFKYIKLRTLCHARMREILSYIHIPKLTVWFIGMKSLSLLRSQCISVAKRYKREYVILLPFPPLWERFMQYVNNNMYYVENLAELIKASPSIHEQYAGTIRWKMTNSDEDSK